MSIRKQYLKSKPVCKATFRIPEEMGNSAKTAPIVGIFNNRTFFSTPMEKLKNGAFTISFVQDGHGMLPLLSYSLKNSVLIKLLNLIFGLVVGGILFALGL